MIARMARVHSVNIATAHPMAIGGRHVMTAIGKRGVDGPMRVERMGLEGDEQADLSVHGGRVFGVTMLLR